MNTSRHEEIYHGYKVVVGFWKGKYKGRAFYGTYNWTFERKLGVVGRSSKEVHLKLRALIDEKNKIEGRDAVHLHQAFLDSIRKPSRGRSTEGRPRNPDKWHCYSCGSHFDGFMGLLCNGAEWKPVKIVEHVIVDT